MEQQNQVTCCTNQQVEAGKLFESFVTRWFETLKLCRELHITFPLYCFQEPQFKNL